MAQDLRLQTDSGKNGGQFLINLETRKNPVVSEGGSLNIFLGAFRFDSPFDLAPFERVNLLIKDSQTEDNSPLVDIDVLAASITALITLTGWNNQTEENAVFAVPAANMVFDLGAETEVDLWMSLTAYNDTAGTEVTLGAGLLKMVADNNVGIPGGPDLMLKSVYDINNNSKCDVADLADSVDYDNVFNKPATFPADLTGAVRFDLSQSLTGPEKIQGRANIAAVESADIDTSIAAQAVKYNAVQVLSGPEKIQARGNIDAVSSTDVDTSIGAQAVKYDAVQVLSGAEKQQARDNMGVEEALAAGSVLFDQAQTLNASEKQQARDNIDAIDSSDLTGAVRHDTVQALSAPAQQQARDNIGAIDSTDLTGAVRFDVAQVLITGERLQARANIAAVESADIDTSIAAQAVKYDAVQALSAGEQTQARDNISASKSHSITKELTVENPTSSEDITFFRAPAALTILELAVVLQGSTPSLTVDIRHAADRSAVGNALINAPSASTSTSIGDVVSSFDDPTVPAGSYIWIETDAIGGTVDAAHIAIIYAED